MSKAVEITDVQAICSAQGIEINEIKAVTGSFSKQLFIINHEFLLRLSESSMALEQEKFKRVAGLNFVPKIIHSGTRQRAGGPLYYTLLTLLPGDDFVNSYAETTPAQQKQLGQALAGFLDGLHELPGPQYDIGLYVPALPAFSGDWRAGHQAYWEILKQDAGKLHLQTASRQVFESAFRFLQAASAALDFQSGPKLLHNDFHPKNVLVHQGEFSGVIDWECSQFGEADFELCHLIHWCVYPPQASIDFRPLLRGLFAAAPRCSQVPELAQRLTIYEIEHEIQQIIWQGQGAEELRVPRLVRWLAGGVEALMGEL